jgi:hypothetical protein
LSLSLCYISSFGKPLALDITSRTAQANISHFSISEAAGSYLRSFDSGDAWATSISGGGRTFWTLSVNSGPCALFFNSIYDGLINSVAVSLPYSTKFTLLE